MMIVFDVAGFPITHERLEVRIQDTRSPDNGLYVNIEEFVPAFTPLTFH